MQRKLIKFVAGVMLAASVSSNALAAESVIETDIVTPDDAIKALMEGNDRFTSGNTLNQDFDAQIAATADGQAPFAGVLSCLDSRVPPEILFDQGIGDIFVGRVAGNVEDTNMVGSMEFAGQLVGIRLLVVMGHTSCGAVKGACAGAELGNLTALLDQIQPAVEIVKTRAEEGEMCDIQHIDHMAAENVKLTIADIREQSPVLVNLEAEGKFKIVGAMYDVATGKVTWL